MVIRYQGNDGTQQAHECLDLPSAMHCITHMIIRQKDFELCHVFEDEVHLLTKEEVLNG